MIVLGIVLTAPLALHAQQTPDETAPTEPLTGEQRLAETEQRLVEVEEKIRAELKAAEESNARLEQQQRQLEQRAGDLEAVLADEVGGAEREALVAACRAAGCEVQVGKVALGGGGSGAPARSAVHENGQRPGDGE